METQNTQNKVPMSHYYGDIVRLIFVAASVVTLLGFPTVTKQLGVPVVFVALGLLILIIAAGISNPIQKQSLIINVFVSFLGLISFIFLSTRMRELSVSGFLFVLNQLLAVAFIFAIYFSIKSLRGFLLEK